MENRYAVFSNGKVRSGFVTEDVIAKLRELVAMSDSQISANLLGGKPRKIKTANSLEKANKLVDKLQEMGLDCYALKLDDNINLSGQAHPSKERSGKRSWSKWAVAFVVLVMMLVALYFFAAKWLFEKPTESFEKIESIVMAGGQPTAIVYGNLAQLRKILKIGGADVDLTEDIAPLSNFAFSSVLGSSEYVFTQTDHVLSRLDVKETSNTQSASTANGLEWLTILAGSYEKSRVLLTFDQQYLIEELDGGVFKLTKRYKVVDGFECPIDAQSTEKLPEIFMRIDRQSIAFSPSVSPLQRFADSRSLDNYKDSPALTDTWRAYRAGSIIAIQIFDQVAMQQDMTGHIVRNAIGVEGEIDNLGLRVEVAPLSQGVTLHLAVDSPDELAIDNAATSLRESINQLTDEHRENLPSVVELLSRLKVEDDDGLDVAVTLDKSMLGEIKSLTSEVLSLAFSGGGFSSSDKADTQGEKLKEHAWDYSLNSKFNSNQPFKADSFAQFRPLFSQGSTAIFVDSIGLAPISQFSTDSEPSKSAFQIKLEARQTTANIDVNAFTWSESGIKYSLSIDQVLGINGQSILEDERCNESLGHVAKNHEPADNANFFSKQVTVAKTVRLIDGTALTDISSVRGKTRMLIPIDVKKMNLKLNGVRTVEWGAGRFRLKSIDGGSVSYEVIGDDKNLVHVNALNKQGQALKWSGSFSSGGSASSDYAGLVDSVDVYFTDKFIDKKVDFNLRNLIPEKVSRTHRVSASATEIEPDLFSDDDRSKLLTKLDVENLSEEDGEVLKSELQWGQFSFDGTKKGAIGRTTTDSSLIFFSNDRASSWSNSLNAKLFIPFIPAVAANPNTLSVDLQLDGGESVNIPVSIDQMTVNGRSSSSGELSSGPYSEAAFSLDLDEKSAPIGKISGVLKYAIPKSSHSLVVPLPDGKSQGKTILQLLGFSFGNNPVVRYKLSNEGGNVFAAVLITRNGHQHKGKIVKQDGVTTLEFSELSGHLEVKLFILDEVERHSETFEMTPSYQ